MSYVTYHIRVTRPTNLVWLRGEVKTPPFSSEARVDAGFLLRRLQRGESLGLPASRPMPAIAAGCYELRVGDRDQTWRIVYHVAADAIVILDVFSKKSAATPRSVMADCRRRLQTYLRLTQKQRGEPSGKE